MHKAERSGQWAVGSGQKFRGQSAAGIATYDLTRDLTSLPLPEKYLDGLSGCARPTAYCSLSRFVFVAVLLLTAHCTLPTTVRAQEVVDKMVATVNAGGLTECGGVCLITYSD